MKPADMDWPPGTQRLKPVTIEQWSHYLLFSFRPAAHSLEICHLMEMRCKKATMDAHHRQANSLCTSLLFYSKSGEKHGLHYRRQETSVNDNAVTCSE